MRDHKSQPPERKPGFPAGDDDVINKYGTYEVQRTCGMENPYPMIAQGLATALQGADGGCGGVEKAALNGAVT